MTCKFFDALALTLAIGMAGTATAGDLDLLAPNLPAPTTQSENDIVIDPLYFEYLCDFNNAQLWNDWNFVGPVGIASITKVMTYNLALDALEPGLEGFTAETDDCVTIASDAVENFPAWMNPALQLGWSVPLDVLLHGMMKRSANGAARAIGKFVAEGIAGETLGVAKAKDDFVQRMNGRASDLAMTNTTYCERHGSSISTPQDQFQLWMNASKHPQFYEWTAPGNSSGLDCGGTINFVSNRVGSPTPIFGMTAFKDGNEPNGSGPGACDAKPICADCLITESIRLGRKLLSFQHKGVGGTINRWGDVQNLLGYGFGKLFTPDLRAHAIEPDTLLKAQAIDALTANLAVSAVITDDPMAGDELRVCGWSVDADGGSTSLGNCTDGGAVNAIPGGPSTCSLSSKLGVDVAFVRLGDPEIVNPEGGGTSDIEAPLLVTAMTNPANNVTELRSWTVVPVAPFEPLPLGPSATFVGNNVVIHRVTDGVFLTAYNDCGSLRLTAWKMAADGTFFELHTNVWNRDSVAGHAIAHGALLNIGGSPVIPLATPVRLKDDSITLITWHFDLTNGKIIELKELPALFSGSELSIAPVNLTSPVVEDRFYLMSYRRDDGSLESAVFLTLETGDAIEVNHASMGTTATNVTGTRILPLGDHGLVTAVRTEAAPEQLRLTVWEPRQDLPTPVTILNVADEQADDLLPGVDLIVDDAGLDFRPLPMNGDPAEADYLTSRLSGGYLEIDVWRIAPRPNLNDSLCCGNGQIDPGEACDGANLNGLTCSDLGFDIGDLTCSNQCQVNFEGCEYSDIGSMPAGYNECGFEDACEDGPSSCEADGTCIGGPCQQTDPNNRNPASLLSRFNLPGAFHPDGNFRDEAGNLYFCHDGEAESVCIDNDGWGVCTSCGQGEGETMLGCSCDTDEACGSGLTCYGDDIGDGLGFCWDEIDGPPIWQCDQGPCGQAPWFEDDEMYCEHYPADGGEARCEPALACDGGPHAKTCAAEGTICLPPFMSDEESDGESDEELSCTSECLENIHCSEAFGWPPFHQCVNTISGLQCKYAGP